MSWRLVEHPGRLPEDFRDPGQTCLRFDLEEGSRGQVVAGRYSHGGQDWYKVLRPGVEYVVEAWMRGSRPGKARLTFSWELEGLGPIEFPIGERWERQAGSFTPASQPTDGPIGRITLQIEGPGTFWIDSLKIYPRAEGFLNQERLELHHGDAHQPARGGGHAREHHPEQP
jgi:hypothetical protein